MREFTSESTLLGSIYMAVVDELAPALAGSLQGPVRVSVYFYCYGRVISLRRGPSFRELLAASPRVY